jgi:hypothetical protein
MKAYKQINIGFEKRVVFGYAGIMSMLSFLILLSPVFAQEDEPIQKNQPKVHYDVKKEFDKDGNLTGYDSTYTWYWSNKGYEMPDFDSLFENFNHHFFQFGDPLDWTQQFRSMPPLDQFWYWNNSDSSGMLKGDSSINQYFHGDVWSHITPAPNQWEFHLGDSLGLSFHDFDDLSEFFNHDFYKYFPDNDLFKKNWEHQDELMNKLKEYQKEQQKLFEKYFENPTDKGKSEPQNEQQKLKSPAEQKDRGKSGKI